MSSKYISRKYGGGGEGTAASRSASRAQSVVSEARSRASSQVQRGSWKSSFILGEAASLVIHKHRLNMELYLQSLFELLWTAVLIGWDPATPSLPRIWVSYTRALLVSQDRTFLCNPLIIRRTVETRLVSEKGSQTISVYSVCGPANELRAGEGGCRSVWQWIRLTLCTLGIFICWLSIVSQRNKEKSKKYSIGRM